MHLRLLLIVDQGDAEVRELLPIWIRAQRARARRCYLICDSRDLSRTSLEGSERQVQRLEIAAGRNMVVVPVQRGRSRVGIGKRDDRHVQGIAGVGTVARRRHGNGQRGAAVGIGVLIHEVTITILNFEFLSNPFALLM